MPSLDGYSLNEEIKKLRKEVFQELIKQRETFSELFQHMQRVDVKLNDYQAYISKLEQKPKKEKKDAKSKKMRSKVSEGK